MGFIDKTFDLKKFARVIHKHEPETETGRDPDELGPEDLSPYLLPIYFEILREDSFTLANLDFDSIGDGDIDNLETALGYSPVNRLFYICEKFKMAKSTAAAGRVFI